MSTRKLYVGVGNHVRTYTCNAYTIVSVASRVLTFRKACQLAYWAVRQYCTQ